MIFMILRLFTSIHRLRKLVFTLLSLFPHTHLRGMRFLMELEYPDGRREDLLDLPF